MQADHAYCENCEEVRPIVIEPLNDPNTSERYLAADVSCAVCGSMICTLYAAIKEAVH